MRSIPLSAFALVLACGTAAAQTARGTVVDDSGRPVSGVVVLMLDSASHVLARSLSDASGSYRVSTARPGSYRLRTLRIGYTPSETMPFALLSGGESTQRLVVNGAHIPLDTVRVVDKRSCRSTSDSAAASTFAVWEQARTALTAAQLTAGTRALSATTIAYERTLEPDQRHVREQHSNVISAYVSQPWKAVSPDSLHRSGYVFTDRNNVVSYFAPDIEALLAPMFLADHCFRLVIDGARPTQVGVAFEPNADRRDVPEIRGTLWVDRASSELRDLEYRYVNILREQQDAGAGGDVDFARLRNGGWAISRWNIRMPVLEQIVRDNALGGTQIRLAEIKVIGGELIFATIPAAKGIDTVWSRPPLTLVGTIVDSVTHAPIAGARIALTGTTLEATADPRGRFAIPGVLPGAYTATMRTPSLDAIGAASERSVVFTDSSATIELRVPTAEQFARSICGSRLGTSGMIVGTVAARGDSAAHAGTTVRAEWTEVKLRDEHGPTAANELRRMEARTDASGTFRFCGVPLNTAIQLEAGTDSVQSERATVRLADGRFARRDLTMDHVADRGAVFSGTVVDSARRPIAGVAVTIPDAGKGSLTDSAGRFSVASVPAGDHHVLIRHVGFGPLDTTLTFRERATVDRNIVLTRLNTLDSVRVNATKIDPVLRDYEDNKRVGLGRFFERDQLDKIPDGRTSTLLAQLPAAQVSLSRLGAYLTSRRQVSTCPPASARGGSQCLESQGFYVGKPGEPKDAPTPACYAQVYLDDILLNPDHPPGPVNIDEFPPASIASLEYYAGAAQTPMRYAQLESKCGVLVIHTRRTP